MTRAGESIQLVVAESLIPSSIRQTRPIADRVVDVVGFVDLRAGGRELVQDLGDPRRGIMRIAHCRLICRR